MTKLIVGLLTIAGIVTAKLLTWYFSTEQRDKRTAKHRATAHEANANKDGRKLGQWFRQEYKR